MVNQTYVSVGRIKDAHSLKGEVFVKLAAKRADWLAGLDHIRVESAKTFQVLGKRPHKDGLILTLEGVSDRTAAEALRGLDVSIPESLLVAAPDEAIYLRQVLGFTVVDRALGALGPVESFATNGAQDLLVVRFASKEQLIPFVQAFVDEIDFKSREIHMNLPEGLIEHAI